MLGPTKADYFVISVRNSWSLIAFGGDLEADQNGCNGRRDYFDRGCTSVSKWSCSDFWVNYRNCWVTRGIFGAITIVKNVDYIVDVLISFTN